MSRHNNLNIILCGPPGTGKTYETTRLAVECCCGYAPRSRTALRNVYNRLVSQSRIKFVTFHQSMSYEDFVEGRRPTTGSGESAGFGLETVPGIFREVAELATSSLSKISEAQDIELSSREIYEMSIGKADNSDDDLLFEDAIPNERVFMNMADIDLNDKSYSSYEEILSKVDTIVDASEDAGKIASTLHSFRNVAQIGDIVVVKRGNKKFFAIGELVGGYKYNPQIDVKEYTHSRDVKWHWVSQDNDETPDIHNVDFSNREFNKLLKENLTMQNINMLINSRRDDNYVLIIDEINRANVSKVLGELITLLEFDKRLNADNEIKVKLPYSGDEFGIPSNLYIIGTMNTADRSIAPIDTALRRRFEFRYMMPDPEVLDRERCEIDLKRLLEVLNKRIEYLYDRDHQIGHAYFIGCTTKSELDYRMRNMVIPLLIEYFFDDWDKIAAVLGDIDISGKDQSGGFLKCIPLEPPVGLDSSEGAICRWEVISEEEGFNYEKLLGQEEETHDFSDNP